MNTHYRDTRKIDPSKGATLGDNTPNDADRIEIGRPSLPLPNGRPRGCSYPTFRRCGGTAGNG